MLRLPFPPLRLLGLLLCFALPSFAQSARWEPSGGSLPRDQVSQLALVFENCEPSAPPSLPSLPCSSSATPAAPKTVHSV